MSKSYYFILNDDCFDKNSQRSNITNKKRPYSKTVYDMNRAVEELDRFDDFETLKIEPNKYKKTENSGEYGIEYDPAKHRESRTVILSHQEAAARAFLKELRGFGLLADVVGSGKTFEASVILSELAVRGKIKSMLLVVPGQVYDSWVNVLEMQFGLGRKILFEAGEDIRTTADLSEGGLKFDDQNRPDRPIIVKTEDFVNWDNDTASMLFDVIVVDEAHHLCKEDGEYAKAMKLLSMMMETKRRANVTYCLLLSATPHSGNLAHMFRLWYFIRCKGGKPGDFEEKEDIDRSEEYKREKEYYFSHICRGATTVMEFIKKVKKSEVTENYAEDFFEFLSSKGIRREKFLSMMSGEQQILVDKFLSGNYEDEEGEPVVSEEEKQRYEQIRERVMRSVASAYHNGILRSIMIRQPSNSLIKKKKTQINYLFYPALPEAKKEVIVQDWFGKKLRINLAKFSLGLEDSVTPIEESGINGDSVSLSDYVKDNRESMPETTFHSYIVYKVFEATADESACDKKGYKHYYDVQLRGCRDSSMRCMVKPFYDKDDLFTAKYEQTKKILSSEEHKNKRVIIFFDYELKKSELMHARFEQAIMKEAAFKDRIILGTASNKSKALEEFDNKEDAILVVKDASFTEGINLQSCNVIINFQVTPDPLAMDQRIGRIFRLGQKNDVTIYSLAHMHKLEGFALMYFARIGLMSSNSGDATIIAGSNNEHMVAVRCDKCQKVELYSQEDYELKKRDDDLRCTHTELCREEDPKGTVMKEISVYDFKCDKCSTVLARSVADESGYLCVSAAPMGRSIMCNTGDKGDRKLYCRKICAMSNCDKLGYGDCPAVEAYRKNKNIGDAALAMMCNSCPNRRSCPEKCRPYVRENAISACSKCSHSLCVPKPHVIDFDERWEAKCPVCGGKIRPVVARTFAAYLRSSWNFTHDEGRAFCGNLLQEAAKVEDIKEVLDADMKD